MSFVIAEPEIVAAAATDLSNIASTLDAAKLAAAGPTTRVLVAAADEVSAAIATVFGGHAQAFQTVSAQAAAFHAELVQVLNASAASYAGAEAANASPLRAIEQDALSAFTSLEAEFEQAPAALASGFTRVFDTVFGTLFGAAADPPFQATQSGTFTGGPSLVTRFEEAALWPVKDFVIFTGLDNQIAVPNSPLLSLFTGNVPGISLFLSNSPPKLLTLLLGESVQYTTYDGMSVVQITPAHPTGNYVVAIHGGAFIFAPSIFHWLDYTITAYQTGATFEVPIYPLLQQGGTAGTVVPAMAGLISSEIAAHGASHVSVIGDSAGGNLALAAVELMVTNNETVPASMVLLSPWLDLTSTNPNIAFVQDPLLPIEAGPLIGKVWAGGLSMTNPMVSPLYASPQVLAGLPPTTVYSGSLDSLAPDVLVLQQEAVAAGAPFQFVLANGEIHDWIILTVDGPQYWPQIDEELGI